MGGGVLICGCGWLSGAPPNDESKLSSRFHSTHDFWFAHHKLAEAAAEAINIPQKGMGKSNGGQSKGPSVCVCVCVFISRVTIIFVRKSFLLGFLSLYTRVSFIIK
jgi:hypothetical protein